MIKNILNSVESPFGEFLKKYSVFIAIGFAVLIGLVILIIVLSGLKRGKGKIEEKPVASKSEYLSLLGGEENIIDKKVEGSRISIYLKDMDNCQPDALLPLGIDSYIKMKERLVLVVKEGAQKVFDTIFN